MMELIKEVINLVPVNYLAVVLAAVVAMVIGYFWYSKMLFGAAWMKEVGLTDAKIRENSKGNMMYVLMMISSLVMALVLSHVVVFSQNYYPDYTPLMSGILSGFWMWLGFIATYAASMVIFEGRSWKWFSISAGYYLVSLVLMGVVIGVLR